MISALITLGCVSGQPTQMRLAHNCVSIVNSLRIHSRGLSDCKQAEKTLAQHCGMLRDRVDSSRDECFVSMLRSDLSVVGVN